MPPFVRRIMQSALRLAASQEWSASRMNRYLIGRLVKVTRTRPHPWSTVHNYTSWTGLTDQSWSARHLPARPISNLPDIDALMPLFKRKAGGQKLSDKSTCLFPTFAQYLTDGFIRTEGATGDPSADANRLKRNTSNHQIDLCPLYGRTPEQTRILRTNSEAAGERGRLLSQMIGEEEYPPFLFKDGVMDPRFEKLDPPLGLSSLDGPDNAWKRDKLFAIGGDRANSAPQVAMFNTLLLREHNRLAGELEQRNPTWDDTRVFETARNIVIVLFIKLVVEEYINHISTAPFPLKADPSAAWDEPWNKPNWMTTEFSLLYRWHSLIPDVIRWGETRWPVGHTFLNNAPLLDGGLRQGFADMSAQKTGALGPFNTTDALLGVERASIMQGRICELAPYSDYRAYVGQQRPGKFEDISSDPEVVRLLREAYGSPDRVEYFVGLFAEDRVLNSPLPELVLAMVAVDAFSQALTNPLLSKHVFNAETFSPYGWQVINETSSIRQLVLRNSPGPDNGAFIGMTQPGWDYQ